MTNPDYGAVCLLVDRSGSMGTIRASAQTAINKFVAAQVGTGKRITVRLDQFDNLFENVTPSTPAEDWSDYELLPRGSTALHDSMALSMTQFGAELAALPEDERPATVIFAVVTDGHENSSREWTADMVKKYVEEQQSQWNWDFVFLAANQDAVLTAAELGIDRGSALTYNTTRAGIQHMSESLNAYAASSFSGERAAFTEADREAAMEED